MIGMTQPACLAHVDVARQPLSLSLPPSHSAIYKAKPIAIAIIFLVVSVERTLWLGRYNNYHRTMTTTCDDRFACCEPVDSLSGSAIKLKLHNSVSTLFVTQLISVAYRIPFFYRDKALSL